MFFFYDVKWATLWRKLPCARWINFYLCNSICHQLSFPSSITVHGKVLSHMWSRLSETLATQWRSVFCVWSTAVPFTNQIYHHHVINKLLKRALSANNAQCNHKWELWTVNCELEYLNFGYWRWKPPTTLDSDLLRKDSWVHGEYNWSVASISQHHGHESSKTNGITETRRGHWIWSLRSYCKSYIAKLYNA